MHHNGSEVFERLWRIEHRAQPRHIDGAARSPGHDLAIDQVIRVGRSTLIQPPPRGVFPRFSGPMATPGKVTTLTMQGDVPTRLCRGCSRSAPAWTERPGQELLDDETRP